MEVLALKDFKLSDGVLKRAYEPDGESMYISFHFGDKDNPQKETIAVSRVKEIHDNLVDNIMMFQLEQPEPEK